MKKINFLIITLFIWVISFNACSTGSDPQPIVNDMFKIPINYALEFVNNNNRIAMEINGIVLNHLNTTKDRITTNVAECIKAMVYRNATTKALDSIVVDYGNKLCYSNGTEFLGKIVVKSTDKNLKNFDVVLRKLKTRYFSITGDFKVTITGAEGGGDFTISSSNLKYIITDKITEEKTQFSISNYNSSYKFIRSEKNESDYIDDIFTFTTTMSGVMPDGATYTFTSKDELKYTYRCKNILGGKATIELSDLGEAIADFGGGDVDKDCDRKVTVSVEGIEYSTDLR